MDNALGLLADFGLYAEMITTLLNDGHPFLARDCHDLGLTSRQLYEARREGVVRRILDRVFVDARVPDSRELRIEAMKLVAPTHAVIADDWAAWIYGIDTFKPSKRHSLIPTVVVPHGRGRIRIEGVECRQALIRPKDIVELDGLLVTTPVRTTSDFLRKKWRPYALASADAMAHAGLVTMEEVWEFVAKLKGYRGIRQGRNLAVLIDAKAQSQGESWTRLRVIDAGFAIPESQWEVILRNGDSRFLDLAYPQLLIAMEYDGREFHTADQDGEYDDERRRLIRSLGFRIIVAFYADIFGTNTSFERELGQYLGMAPFPRRW